jgi:Spy/CpxP family protein refolding chaperone
MALRSSSQNGASRVTTSSARLRARPRGPEDNPNYGCGKGQVHDGQQQPINDLDLRDEVRQRLADLASAGKVRRSPQRSDVLLAGKLFDGRGNRMTPFWSRKRWRHYGSQAALQG